MAKAVITLHDAEDGSVSLRAEFWPIINDPKKMTDAQISAIFMVEALAGLEGVKSADFFGEDGGKLEPVA